MEIEIDYEGKQPVDTGTLPLFPGKAVTLKALTISQPYASLIADGKKFVENRTWPTSYRGLLAIHAGKGSQYLRKAELADYPTGCVIAVARLVGCVSKAQVDRAAKHAQSMGLMPWLILDKIARHEHTEGPWCWVLEDVWKIDPIPMRGAQGLWECELNVPGLVV